MVSCCVELLAVEMVMLFFGEIEIKNREIPQNDQFKYPKCRLHFINTHKCYITQLEDNLLKDFIAHDGGKLSLF